MKPEYWWVISDCKCFPHSLFFISKNNIHAPEQIISRHAALYWTKHRSSTKEKLIIIVLSPDAETFHHLLTATSISLLSLSLVHVYELSENGFRMTAIQSLRGDK